MADNHIISEMTIEEKSSLCSGEDFWNTKAVDRLGIPQITMSDGPYGIRKQSSEENYLDFRTSKKYVCFPTGAGMAASFNKELWHEMGEILGRECRAEGIDVLLGPAINIKRSPLGGRNFEYLSEDPLVSGKLAAEYIKGLQSEGTSACVKHFAVNSQETRRMSASSNIEERALREIYLTAFEIVVKEAKPDTLMCSYNQLNHVFVAENERLLTKILREEWGFDGCVITDWGAVCNRIRGLRAGVDIEMPSSGGITDREIAKAVREKCLPEQVLNRAAGRILKLIEKHRDKKGQEVSYSEDHKIARELAQESMVLLKNEQNLLPLPDEGCSVALIGSFAEEPRIEGGGSSHINSFYVETPRMACREWPGITFYYAKGYEIEKKEIAAELLEEAVSVAEKADYAVIVAGLPESFESESYDRKNMELPEQQNELIRRISKVQPNTIVVLQNGSPVLMPWLSGVKAVLEAYLGGEGAGGALMDILFGKVNPSGCLAETFPLCIEDTPCYLDFPGYGDEVDYTEGVFVGYRYYISKKIPVLFPFGYGLSYTDFNYDELSVSTEHFCEGNLMKAQVRVTNMGSRAGMAVIQLYVEPQEDARTIARPLRELKAFEKIWLDAKEEKLVTLELTDRAFTYYDTALEDWYLASGHYKIQIGKDCERIVCEKEIFAESANRKSLNITDNTLIGDLLNDAFSRKVMNAELPELMKYMGVSVLKDETGTVIRESIPAFIYELPLRAVISFTAGNYSKEKLKSLIEKLKKGETR